MLRHFHKYFALGISCGVVFCGLGACSIHPLPNDVTGIKTATIVRKIRCEAKGALEKAGGEIRRSDGRHEEDGTSPYTAKQPLGSWRQAKLDDLQRIGIVYNFTLEGVESGGLTFNADVIKPLKNGTETFSPSLGNTLKRDNTRTFTVSDSYSSLASLKTEHCNFNSSDPNYEYPIVGRIGLDEMIQTFIRLAVSGDVVGPEDPTKTIPLTLTPAGPPTMVDTLIFTTTISAGLTPKVTFSPAGTGVQLMDATLVGSVMRMDTHQVIIGMALGKPSAGLSASASAGLSPKTTALFFTHRAKDSANTGEALAAQAVTQEFIRRGLRRVDLAIVP